MALISVIIPCYNVEMWIDRCISSIVNQTFGIDELQVICVDDYSTDNTVKKIMAWEEKYPNQIVVILSPQNGRQGRARNIGLEYANAKWISFIDADDWIEPLYFDKLYHISEIEDVEVVECKIKRDFSKEGIMFSDINTGGSSCLYNINSIDERRPYIVVPPWGLNSTGKIIKKDFLIRNSIYFPEFLAYEDGLWGSILTMCVKKVYVLEEYLYHYFVNNESTVLMEGNHHWDFITVQTALWNEWIERGYFENYKDELEMEHIYSAYLQGLKTAVLRFGKPNYCYYRLIRELVISRIPDYKSNPYIESGILKEEYRLMMVALTNELSKQEFILLAENIKKMGI